MVPRYLLSYGIKPCFLNTTLFCCSAHNAFVHDARSHQVEMSTPSPLLQNSKVNSPRVLLCHRCSITILVQTIGCSLSCGIAIHT